MATLAELKLLARQRADMENSTFIGEAELKNYVNASYAELYDLLTSRFEDYYSQTQDFTIAAGTSEQSLPADFYKLRGLDVSGGGAWRSVPQFSFADRNGNAMSPCVTYRIMGSAIKFMPQGSAAGSYRLWYIPRFAPLSADSDALSNVLDFEEYVICDVAIKMLVKEESDVSALMAIKEALKQRVLAMSSSRDAGAPERVADVQRSCWGE